MPDLFTAQAKKVFEYWKLEPEYKNYRAPLVESARQSCEALKATYPTSNVEKEDFVPAVTAGLLELETFKTILLTRQHLRLGVHEVLAGAMARYLLDKDWSDINP